MKIYTAIITGLFCTSAWCAMPDIVKVTPKNNPACVEYVTYQGEMYCTTKKTVSTPIDPAFKSYETQKIMFDHRPWQAAWGKQTPMITTVEYVPFGDNIDQWNELVTSQFIPNIQQKMTPKESADHVLQNIKQAGFNPDVKFHLTTPTQVLFEFRITSPSNQVQDELQLITQAKNGFYVLHYVIKKADMGEANRKKWIALLKKSHPK